MKQKLAYYVVQEGGTSEELYLHTFNQRRQAERYRASCKRGAYRSSPIGRLPITILDALTSLDGKDLFDAMFELISAAIEVDY